MRLLILEVLYSTGMRRSEVLGLQLGDIDVERGPVMIRQGKGRRDRMVPIGERASRWVERYRAEARGELLKGGAGGGAHVICVDAG